MESTTISAHLIVSLVNRPHSNSRSTRRAAFDAFSSAPPGTVPKLQRSSNPPLSRISRLSSLSRPPKLASAWPNPVNCLREIPDYGHNTVFAPRRANHGRPGNPGDGSRSPDALTAQFRSRCPCEPESAFKPAHDVPDGSGWRGGFGSMCARVAQRRSGADLIKDRIAPDLTDYAAA